MFVNFSIEIDRVVIFVSISSIRANVSVLPWGSSGRAGAPSRASRSRLRDRRGGPAILGPNQNPSFRPFRCFFPFLSQCRSLYAGRRFEKRICEVVFRFGADFCRSGKVNCRSASCAAGRPTSRGRTDPSEALLPTPFHPTCSHTRRLVPSVQEVISPKQISFVLSLPGSTTKTGTRNT